MKYAELSEDAKARARDWWREGDDYDGSDNYEDMAKCLSFLGIEVDCPSQRRPTSQPAAWNYNFEWEGFWTQGSGLVFTGKWSAEQVDLAGLQEYAPKDQTLADLGARMVVLMLRWPQARANITGSMRQGMQIEDAFTDERLSDDADLPDADRIELHKLVREAAGWCYDQLEADYEYLTSDDAVAENIECNEYEFDEDGTRS